MPRKKTKTKAKEVKKEAPLAPAPKCIRINFQGANQHRSFSPGDVLRVPEDVPEDSARGWLRARKAVEVKPGEGPAETK